MSQIAHPQPTGRSRTVPVVVGAVVAVLLVVAFAVWLSAVDDDTATGDPAPVSAAEQPGADASTSADVPTSAETPTPSAPSLDPTAAADRAVDAGVPALVPDAFGDQVGAVTAATYDAATGLWQLTVSTDAGDVVVRQHDGTARRLLATYARGATPGADVDLARWGLGTWATSTTADAGVLSRDLPGGGAMVSGPDVATAAAVARTLLTHENTRGGEQD